MDIVEERVAILVADAQYGKVIYRKIRDLNVCEVKLCPMIRIYPSRKRI
jgi:hypothetical protein